MIIDALSLASKSVSGLLGLKLDVPPIPIDTFTKDKKQNDNDGGFKLPPTKIKVYEVWKVFLEDNDKEISEAFVVIGADFITNEYIKGKWKNVDYRGCYTTFEDAKNEIDGFLR
jgi:hypothetical protein